MKRIPAAPAGKVALMLNYIYKIADTTGTTGFAVCEPDPKPDFDDGLALLSERPLDVFLHRHMLQRLLEVSPDFWPQLAEACLGRRQKSTAALLLEGAKIASFEHSGLAPYLSALRALATPWHEATPLTLLAAPPPSHASRSMVFHRNIHQHDRLPFFEMHAAVKPAADALANAAGTLQKLHANFTPSQTTEDIPGAAAVFAAASSTLAAAGLVDSPEMRHEASLSPIALLRAWRLTASLPFSRTAHTLSGTVTAYGRGLKLAQARAACNMEIIERVCAHAVVEPGGPYGKIGAHELVRASYAQLVQAQTPALSPASILGISPSRFIPELASLPLHWLPASTASGRQILVPAQAVYLFSNLDEVCIFDAIGSTGLAAGASVAMARLAALSEVLERDAHATTPFDVDSCFELQSRDAVIRALLDDYLWRGIHVQFQDISNEFGFPVYRAFVETLDGRIVQATGAGLSGPRAALAALTETPWPYSWAQAAQKSPSAKGLPNLPKRMLEDLPDYSFGSFCDSLALLEQTLGACGHEPVYMDISRPEFPFPVYRAFIPGLAIDPELEAGPGVRLLARLEMRANRHMKYKG